MRQREDCPISHLTRHSFCDSRVIVSEDDGTKSHGVIDILVSVDIPDMTSLATYEKDRRGPLDKLCGALTEGLRATWNHPCGPLLQSIAALQTAGHRRGHV